jgi:hypothetical protein
MRQKVNQTEELTRLDALKAKEDLKKVKQEDLERYLNNKAKAREEQRELDRNLVSSKVAEDQKAFQAEQQKKLVGQISSRTTER